MSIGVVPAWSGWPVTVTATRRMPTMWLTTPMGSPSLSSTGPCSICSSTNAAMLPGPLAARATDSGWAPMRRIACARLSPASLHRDSMASSSVPANARLPTQETP
jgi:hypothetical protein